MSGSSEKKAWSNNPNAPHIPYVLHFDEKTNITGIFLGAIFYGITVILFFQCIGALLDPVDRKTRGIKWGLVAYITVLFSASTVSCTIGATTQSLSFIDNREFPGNDLVVAPGPLGYESLINNNVVNVVGNVMFFVIPWLAGGFSIYRCYVIYSKNSWVIVLPCLMYLAGLALSIASLYYQTAIVDPFTFNSLLVHLDISLFSISLSFSVLLTLMIATRLIRHRRSIRNAMGPATNSGLYDTVITMIVESFALYAVASLLYLGLYAASSSVKNVFGPIFANIQVISPLLIVLRVASRTALKSQAVSPGKIGSIRFKTRGSESTAGDETIPGENLTSPVETNGVASGEPGAVVEKMIEEVPIR